MIIYSFLFVLILAWQFGVPQKIDYKYSTSIFFIFLLLLSVFRYAVGVDYMNYHEFMRANEVERFELFGRLLYEIDVIVFNQEIFPLFFTGHALLALIGVYKFICTFSPDRKMSVLLFFSVPVLYFSTFNLVRQWAAVGLLYWIFSDIARGRRVSSMWFRIAALPLVHLSAMIVLPIFFLAFRKLTLRLILLLILGVLLAYSSVFEILGSSKYFFYVAHRLIASQDYSNEVVAYPFVLLLLSALISSRKKYLSNLKLVHATLKLAVFSACSMLVAVYFGIDETIITRVSTYFFLLFVVLLPQVGIVLTGYRKGVHFVVMIFCIVLFIRLIFVNGELYSLVPYRTYISLL